MQVPLYRNLFLYCNTSMKCRWFNFFIFILIRLGEAAAVSQLVIAFASHAEISVIETEPRQT